MRFSNPKYLKSLYTITTVCVVHSAVYINAHRCFWPDLSVGEHDLHTGNITWVGGHKRWKCRSMGTDYQTNCITVTVLISTYLFVLHVLSSQTQSQLPTALEVLTPLVR